MIDLQPRFGTWRRTAPYMVVYVIAMLLVIYFIP